MAINLLLSPLMIMSKRQLGEVIVSHLREQGYKRKDIDQFSYETRFYHDMNVWGDDVDSWLLDLKALGIDISDFQFDDYFPMEFPSAPLWRRILSMVVPFTEVRQKPKENYKPLTLKMIEDILIAKDWGVVLDGY